MTHAACVSAELVEVRKVLNSIARPTSSLALSPTPTLQCKPTAVAKGPHADPLLHEKNDCGSSGRNAEGGGAEKSADGKHGPPEQKRGASEFDASLWDAMEVGDAEENE